ncbi:MAG: 4Fe-4S binding protein [Anaerovoracaceae bacterium]
MSSSGEHIIDRSIDCIGCGQCVEACMPDALKVPDSRFLSQNSSSMSSRTERFTISPAAV